MKDDTLRKVLKEGGELKINQKTRLEVFNSGRRHRATITTVRIDTMKNPYEDVKTIISDSEIQASTITAILKSL